MRCRFIVCLTKGSHGLIRRAPMQHRGRKARRGAFEIPVNRWPSRAFRCHIRGPLKSIRSVVTVCEGDDQCSFRVSQDGNRCRIRLGALSKVSTTLHRLSGSTIASKMKPSPGDKVCRSSPGPTRKASVSFQPRGVSQKTAYAGKRRSARPEYVNDWLLLLVTATRARISCLTGSLDQRLVL